MCRDTKCPAVLVECLFMDNKEDCSYLLSNEGKETIANLLVNGIINYISNL
jgi:N-acetylmuramoyl-L-alanine amidase